MAAVALVTGGNRGIGLAIALRLREVGYEVVVGSRSGTAPDGLNAVELDVSSPTSIVACFDRIEADFGPVDVVIANAGITRDTGAFRFQQAACMLLPRQNTQMDRVDQELPTTRSLRLEGDDEQQRYARFRQQQRGVPRTRRLHKCPRIEIRLAQL